MREETQSIKEGILSLGWYLSCLAIILIVGFLFVFTEGYTESFLLLNSKFHTNISDQLALNFTHVADGILILTILLLCTWDYDKKIIIYGLVTVLVTGVLVQFLKVGFFPEFDRPSLNLLGEKGYHLLQNLAPKRYSFPSGHATSFAAGGVVFAWFYRDLGRVFQVLIALCTFFLAYTRVHIGVHYFADVLVGLTIGTIGGLLLVTYLDFYFGKKLNQYFTRWESTNWDGIVLAFGGMILFSRYVQLIFSFS